jgi:DNA-binding response OmpR family regulator
LLRYCINEQRNSAPFSVALFRDRLEIRLIWDEGLLDDAPRDRHGRRIPWRKRVLLVEDDLDMIGLLTDALDLKGYKVEIARTRKQAETSISAGICDFLLTDLCLLGLTGYEVLRLWRDCTATRPFPAIAFTNVEDEDHVLFAYYAGADVVLVEPFGFNDLLDWVDRL